MKIEERLNEFLDFLRGLIQDESLDSNIRAACIREYGRLLSEDKKSGKGKNKDEERNISKKQAYKTLGYEA